MKIFLKAFFIRFALLWKRQLKQVSFLLLLLLLPILCTILRNTARQSESTIQIGLYCENPDAFTTELLKQLTDTDSIFTFILTDSLDSLLYQLERGELECAYQFPSNYQSMLLQDDYKRKIQLYTTPSTIAAELANEVIFSYLFQNIGDEIVFHYIENSPLFEEIDSSELSMVKERYHQYKNGAATFHINYEILQTDGTTEPVEPNFTINMPVRGIIAIMIFISALLGGISWQKDIKKGIRMSRIPSILAPTLLMTLSGFVALLLTKEFTSLLIEWKAILFYLFLITGFTSLLVSIIQNTNVLTAAIPVFVIGSLLFCPIFIDLSNFIPYVKVVQNFLLPYYYITFFL